MNKQSRILVIGKGLIGKKIAELLLKSGYKDTTLCTHSDLELLDQGAVNTYFENKKPQYVFFCAVKAITDFESGQVGDGEEAYANIMMQCNVAEAARVNDVKKMIMLGSAMLYPWNLKTEEVLGEKQIEQFNLPGYRKTMEASVIGKLVGLKLCQYYNHQYNTNFIYCMPTHIYGGFQERKNLYFLERMVMEICDAKEAGKSELFLDVFGKGEAKKQFLHVEDCADAIIEVMEVYENKEEPAINICGSEISCWKDIVNQICETIKYDGKVLFNSDRDENMTNRICSEEKLEKIGWTQKIKMKDGILMLCREYQSIKGKIV